MKLFASTTSPFARKVLLLLHEKGAIDRVTVEYLDPWSAPKALTASNPLSKVPTLDLTDGRTIVDSAVICEYLDRNLPGPRLIPEAGDDYWRTRVTEALANGLLEASIAVFTEIQKRPEALRWPEWVEFQQQAIGRTLDAFECDMDWIGERFDYAAICVLCALGHLEFRNTAGDWRQDRPRLTAWFDGLRERISVKATEPFVAEA
jgi:glutathione S-transferase